MQRSFNVILAEAVNNDKHPGNRSGRILAKTAITILKPTSPEGPKASPYMALRKTKKTLGFKVDSGYFPDNMLAISEIKSMAKDQLKHG